VSVKPLEIIGSLRGMSLTCECEPYELSTSARAAPWHVNMKLLEIIEFLRGMSLTCECEAVRIADVL